MYCFILIFITAILCAKVFNPYQNKERMKGIFLLEMILSTQVFIEALQNKEWEKTYS
ncbi:hypothetical protein JN06_02652 [Bacteroides zoogleoformans]|nr:hypothetical protein JN06_02652 [Bacteroides zoogleoformans]